MHTRLSAALTIEKNSGNRDNDDERAIMVRGSEDARPGNEGDRSATHRCCVGGGQAKTVLVDPSSVAGPSKTSLEWIGSDELFFSVRSSDAGSSATPVVDSTWFNWKGKVPWASFQGDPCIAYAVVKFPYSDMIGRGDPLETRSPKVNPGGTNGCQALSVPDRNSPAGVETLIGSLNASRLELEFKQKYGEGKEGSSKLLRPICEQKRTKANTLERLCFICQHRMSSGKDVAALLNLRTNQMVCGSRNKRGIFHVYHPTCLIDWISMCELKTFTGQVYEREIFCPECQGTGLNLPGAQLERPRYNLAQVFDRILELVQARKAWTDNRAHNPVQQDTRRCGLLFRDHVLGTVQSRGLVHYYSGCVYLLTGSD